MEINLDLSGGITSLENLLIWAYKWYNTKCQVCAESVKQPMRMISNPLQWISPLSVCIVFGISKQQHFTRHLLEILLLDNFLFYAFRPTNDIWETRHQKTKMPTISNPCYLINPFPLHNVFGIPKLWRVTRHLLSGFNLVSKVLRFTSGVSLIISCVDWAICSNRSPIPSFIDKMYWLSH